VLIGSSLVAALRLPPSAATAQLSRRSFAAAALGTIPLLASRAAHAGFALKLDDIPSERLAELEKNRGPLLGEGEQAYRIKCSGPEDVECLARKRELAKPKIDFGPVTPEDRKAAIERQAKSCRAFCGRVTLADCDGRDTECIERKKAEMVATGQNVGGEGLVPYIAGAAVIVGARIATAPEKTANPKGMEVRQKYYEKRKADTASAKKSGVSNRSAFEAAAAAKAEKAAKGIRK